MSGSDFAPGFFSVEERRDFGTILVQLRSFERTVAQSFRKFEGRLEIIEESIKKNKDSLTGTKGSITKLRNNLSEFKIVFEEKFRNVDKLGIKYNDRNLENFDELENSSINDSNDTIVNIIEAENEENNQAVMTADPFLNTGGFIGTFDGNPTSSFTKWIEKFKDILSLMAEPTEAQKLARLRFCLTGQARIVFDSINPAPATLAEAIAYLKRKYEDGNSKIIARQILSNCRHAPGESVFEFANRLSDTVRTALSGEEEETIKKRLLDEFLDRLIPDLQFEVKAQRPQDYSNAYEIAQHYKLLLASRRKAYNSNISVADLAEKVEALTIQNEYPETRTCYNCGVQGHISRYCREPRKSYYSSRYYRPQNNVRSKYGETSHQSYRDYEEHSGNRKDNYRDSQPFRRYRNDSSSSGSRSPERGNWRERKRNNSGSFSPNYGSRSPNRNVRFERNSSPRIGAVSPYLLALVALICLI
ncbi:hypothetical protein ACQ4LE_004682 [Meloidogyne hapla]|uniref:CCHC-type domain-containing protein n=1 Tax=Meloidogyne hapla TaxID=6305 RepID=A0A1I8BI54_MELHA